MLYFAVDYSPLRVVTGPGFYICEVCNIVACEKMYIDVKADPNVIVTEEPTSQEGTALQSKDMQYSSYIRIALSNPNSPMPVNKYHVTITACGGAVP